MVQAFTSKSNRIDKHILSFVRCSHISYLRFHYHYLSILQCAIFCVYLLSFIFFNFKLHFGLVFWHATFIFLRYSAALLLVFPFSFSFPFYSALFVFWCRLNSRIQLYSSRIFQSFLARFFGNALVLYQPNNSFQCFAFFVCLLHIN